jgi:cytochrome c oxidase subunit 2
MSFAEAWPPLNYLTSAGKAAAPVVALTWGLLAISVAVVIIISALVAVGVWRGRPWPSPEDDLALAARGGGLRWLWIGVGVSTLALVASLVWTVATLVAVSQPPQPPPPLTIRVVGHQWWWEAVYPGPSGLAVVTANELHIPVGQPVRVELRGADVIHSFWVPQLAGKTDAIPGRTNLTWIEADRPGVYLGQCTEYCGRQHAHMGFTVVAEPAAAFAAWRAREAAPAPAPVDPAAIQGEQVFVRACGDCHTVRGTAADGRHGPDLTHLMSRGAIASGALANTPGNLAGWIANPQALKPGARMPVTFLSGPQLTAVEAYLETLE